MNIISHVQEMLAKATPSAYVALALAGICAVLTLFGALQGLRRGVVRQTVRVLTIALSAVIAYFTARGITNGAIGFFEGKTMEEALVELGAFAAIQEKLDESLVSFICSINPEAIQHILALPLVIVVSPIIFFLTFVFVSGILLIPHAILCGVFGFTKRKNNVWTRISGLVMGAAQGLLVSAIVLLPISSVVGVVNATADGIESKEETVMLSNGGETASAELGQLEEAFINIYGEYLSDIAGSPILALLDNCGGKLINNSLSSVKIGGVTRDMRDTIPSLFDIANEAMKLSELDVNNLTEADKDTIITIVDKLMDEPFTASIIVEGFRVAANAVDCGVVDLSMLEEPYADIVRSAVAAFTDSTHETVKTDLGTLCQVFFIISDTGIMSGEEIDLVELISAPEEDNVIIKILDELDGNDRFDSVITTALVTLAGAVEDGTIDLFASVPEDFKDILIEVVGVFGETESLTSLRGDVVTLIEVFTLVKDVELGEDTDYVSLLFDAEDGEDSIIVAALKKLSGSRFDGAVLSAIRSFASNPEFTSTLDGTMKGVVQPFLDVFADEEITLDDVINDIEAIQEVVILLNDNLVFEEGADYVQILLIKGEEESEALIQTVVGKLENTDFAEPLVEAFKALANKDENGQYTLLADSNGVLKTVVEPLLSEVARTETIENIETDLEYIIEVVALLEGEGFFEEDAEIDYMTLLFERRELPDGQTDDSFIVKVIDVFVGSRYDEELTEALTTVATDQLDTEGMTPALSIVMKAVLNLLDGIDNLTEVKEDVNAIGEALTILEIGDDVDMLALLKQDEDGNAKINLAIEALDTPELQAFLLEVVNGLADGVIRYYDGIPAEGGEVEVSLGDLGNPTLSFVQAAMEVFAEIDTVAQLESDVNTISGIIAILEREELISEEGDVSVDVIVLFTEQIMDGEGNPVFDENGEPVTVIDEILLEFEENPHLNPVLLALVRSMSDNIELMNVGAPFDMLVASIADVFAHSTEATVVDDVETVSEVFAILAGAGVFDEGADAVEILAVKDGNGETVVDRVVVTLRGNERTAPIVTDFTKISLSLMMSNVTGAGATGGASNFEEIEENYESVKGDIDTVVTDVIKTDYNLEDPEEKQAAITEVSSNISAALNNTLGSGEEGAEDVVPPEVVDVMAEYVLDNYNNATMDDLVQSGLYEAVTDENGEAVTDENGDPVYELSDDGMTDVILSYYEAYLKGLGMGGGAQ